jgi:hypothetical protein
MREGSRRACIAASMLGSDQIARIPALVSGVSPNAFCSIWGTKLISAISASPANNAPEAEAINSGRVNSRRSSSGSLTSRSTRTKLTSRTAARASSKRVLAWVQLWRPSVKPPIKHAIAAGKISAPGRSRRRGWMLRLSGIRTANDTSSTATPVITQ